MIIIIFFADDQIEFKMRVWYYISQLHDSQGES